MEKDQFELEYLIKTSPQTLYSIISSPSGLSEWFADDVNIKDGQYTFFWDGSEEIANLVRRNKGESIKFQWEDDEGTDYFFEMLIRIDPITKEIALIITDYAEEDEIEEAKLLWDNNVAKLKQVIGG